MTWIFLTVYNLDYFQVEVAAGFGVFLPTYVYRLIDDKATLNNDWSIIVREFLIEVYKNDLSKFSATGKRMARPPIDQRILAATEGIA